MKMKSIALAAGLAAFPVQAYGQDGEAIMLEYVPEGQVIERDGESVIFYTFDQFSLIAELDVEYGHALELIDGLRAMLNSRSDAFDECSGAVARLGDSIGELSEQHEICGQQRSVALSSLQSCNDSLDQLLDESTQVKRWHPVWGPIAVGALGAISVFSILELSR